MRVRHLLALTVYVAAYLAAYSYWSSDRSLTEGEKQTFALLSAVPVTVALGSFYLLPARCPRCRTWSLGPVSPIRLPFLLGAQVRSCIKCHGEFRKTPGSPWVRV
jgi:hypothetical protein